MKKILIFSIMCIVCQIAYAQTAKIGYSFTNNSACADPSDVNRGAEIHLTDNSNPTAASQMWTISGTTAPFYGSSFTHLFTAPGTYRIVLTATFNSGGGTVTRKDSVDVVIHPMPVFEIVKGGDDICPGGSIPLSYTTTSTITDAAWDFGDGGVSTLHNPVHKYDNNLNIDAYYPVSLILTDNNGCRARVDSTNFIHVRSKPEVAFTIDKNYFCFVQPPTEATPVFTNYTDTSANRSFANNTYIWKFGDGTTESQSSLINPTTHTYSGIGTYIPKLIATDQYGCTDSFQIRASQAIVLRNLVLNYTVSDTLICELPATVSLQAQIPTFSYEWKTILNSPTSKSAYGQGAVIQFTKNHSQTGTYYFEIKAEDKVPGGPALCSVSDTFRIRVYDRTPSTIFANDTNECDPGHSVNFSNVSTYPWADDYGNAVTNWYFGDGTNTPNSHTTTHIFGSNAMPDNPLNSTGNGYGNYRVMMTGTTPYGCPMDTAYQWIHIFRMRAVATYTVPAPPAPPHGCRIELDLSSEDLAEGTQREIINPADSGHYIRLLNIEDSLVTSSDITTYVWWWDSTGQWNKYDTTRIDNLADAFAEMPHIYADTGIYTVYLTMINLQGCEHSIRVQTIM
ncbi:MAG: hypothetical protein LBH82_01510, partial [Bacteroidales bacterium]|nr:hypothetical protein [Bacteroidales bacterium]